MCDLTSHETGWRGCTTASRFCNSLLVVTLLRGCGVETSSRTLRKRASPFLNRTQTRILVTRNLASLALFCRFHSSRLFLLSSPCSLSDLISWTATHARRSVVHRPPRRTRWTLRSSPIAHRFPSALPDCSLLLLACATSPPCPWLRRRHAAVHSSPNTMTSTRIQQQRNHHVLMGGV